MTQARATASARFHLVVALVAAALAGMAVGLALTAAQPVPGVTEPDAVVRYGLPVVRVVLDLAAVVTVGLNLLPILIGYDRPKHAEQVLGGARRVAAVAALGWALAALVALVMQTAEVKPGTGVSPGAVADYVAEVGAGKALVFVAAVAFVSFGLGIGSVRVGESVPAELRTAVALFGLLPLPVTGHATNFAWRDFTMISLELHVLGAVAWTGGLGAVVVLLATNRTLLATALPRFSRLATVCLGVVAATGLFNAVVELTGDHNLFGALFGTGYGVLVLLKLTCLTLLGALGANIRWRLMPGIVRHQRTALVGWAALELSVMGLAFGFAVVLSRAPVA
ncbi:MAG: copper resistance protein CopD [Actinophytocola sp.]|uniref:copper resistance D family protein n=1 Tax=Actinophytocola sp. TaxID=1872138 RepID=UPI00132BAD95|nr:CopD family protein [Actinophytocola sp.]MPZ81384.1 copper resistance protein CopD [Actinophytocola sp.]